MRFWKRSIAFTAANLLVAAVAWCQTGTGNIQGTVKDASGAVVPKAHVALLHTATNRQYDTEANGVGFYLFPSIELGDYRISVTAAGMQAWKGQLHLLAGQTAEVETTLKPGTTTTTVEVASDVAPLVTTNSPTLATVVEPERIQQLPVNGRMVDQLLFMTTPGAIQDSYSSVGAYRVPEIYGLRFATQLTQDGAPLEDRAWGTEPNRPPGMDTIAEFRAETNSSSAKFDRPGTFIMTTKSGTNQLHGSAFETARNSGLGVARARTDYYTKPPHLVRNEFGASLGGPVFLPKVYNGKNKTFFFVAYEGLRLRQDTTGSMSVPTPAAQQGDFSGLKDANGRLSVIYDPWSVAQANATTFTKTPFPGNQIPVTRESPLAKYLNSITPLPTLAGVNPLVGPNWYGPIFANENQFTVTAKVDQRLSSRDQLSFRYSRSPSTLLNGSNQDNNSPPSLDGRANIWGDFANNNNAVANWTHTFSPTFFGETLITVARDFAARQPGTGTQEITSTLGLPNPFKGFGFPLIDSDGFGYSFDSGVNPDQIWTNSYIFNQDFTKVHGRHELQFGVRVRLDKYRELEDQQTTQGEVNFNSVATALEDPTAGNTYTPVPFTGSTAADFFLGVDGTYNNRFNRAAYPYTQWETSAYFQDNFRATSRLTLNLGLRYEFINPIQVTDHSMLGFDVANKKIIIGNSLANLAALGDVLPSAVTAFQNLGMQFETAQQAGLPSSLVYKNPYNFDPRVGAAYRLTQGAHPVVVRGGYSIFQFNQPLRMTSGYGYASSPQSATLQVNPDSAATSPDGLSNYLLRAVPTVVAGANSASLMDTAQATGIVPGKAYEYFVNPHLPTPRAQEWNLTFEKEVMANTVASVGYIGTHASNLGTEYSFNDATPTYLWYLTTHQALPTGTYANVGTNAYDRTLYGQMYQYENIGWSNNQSIKLELEHRYSKGYAFQVFYVMSNALAAGGQSWYGASLNEANQYLPGAVPTNLHDLLRLEQYARDTTVPKHLVRWNWVVDLPLGRGKLLGRNMNRVLDKVVGGWQVAGFGSITSNYDKLYSKNWGAVGKAQVYGTKYPVQDCTSGVCYNGYLYDNGYISPKLRNARNAAGQCTGICGIPDNYQPYNQPLITWGQTAAPANMPAGTNLSSYWDTNTVWVPLQDGTVARTSYTTGMNPLQNQYILGPFSWSLNASLFKVVPIREKMFLRLNADFFSVLNRPGMPQPGTNGVIDMNTSANSPRVLQMTARLTW
jgi:hypothetical protein